MRKYTQIIYGRSTIRYN